MFQESFHHNPDFHEYGDILRQIQFDQGKECREADDQPPSLRYDYCLN